MVNTNYTIENDLWENFYAILDKVNGWGENKVDVKKLIKSHQVLDFDDLDANINNLEFSRYINDVVAECLEIASDPSDLDNLKFRYLAGKLVMLKQEIEVEWNQDSPNPYFEFVGQAVKDGLYDSKITDIYSKVDLIRHSAIIDNDYNYGYDYSGANVLTNRYLIKKDGKAYERPQYAWLTMALLLASPEKAENRDEMIEKFYHAIASRQISLATPILLNLRRPQGSLSSCFITAMDDSLTSIYYTLEQIAQISKNAGGVGVSLSRIRCKNSSIRGVKGKSNGVTSWIKLINDTAVAVNQQGERAGAVTVALAAWHYDIEDFLQIQTENGDHRQKSFDVFPQIAVPDLLIKRAKADAYWTLFDPHEIREKYNVELCELWGDQFDEFYCFLEQRELEFKRKVKAKELLKESLKVGVETGLPYWFFTDTVNRMNPNKHVGSIDNANLCVPFETPILTSNGYEVIGELAGQHRTIWNGFEWVGGDISMTSPEPVEMLKIKFDNCVEQDFTLDHKFLVMDGKIKQIEKRAADLVEGDRIIKCNYPIIPFNGKSLKHAYEQGFFAGDGNIEDTNPVIHLYGEKQKLRPFFTSRSNHPTTVRLPYDMKPKYFVPAGYDVNSRITWLAGLLDADGAVCVNSKGSQSIYLTSNRLDFLREIRLMLHTLGIESRISKQKDAGVMNMSHHKKKSFHKAVYQLILNSTGCFKLHKFQIPLLRLKIHGEEPNRNATQFIRVVDVIKTGRKSQSFCVKAPLRHTAIFNGIITKQCVESFSNFKPSKVYNREFQDFDKPKSDLYIQNSDSGETHVCNLVSINLTVLNREDIPEVSALAVRILDNTIELTTPPVPEAAYHNERYRIIGIGYMGLHDFLVRHKKPYKQSGFISDLFEEFSYHIVSESAKLAEERGAYPAFEGSDWSKGILFGKDQNWFQNNKTFMGADKWLVLSNLVKKGIRNGGLIAIAPNTSTSLLMGSTASILPTYKQFFIDKASKGSVPVAPPLLDNQTRWFYSENVNMDQQNVIGVVSEIQKWTDQGISMELFINMNNGITAKDLWNMYMSAWEKGCKTVYYLRSVTKKYDDDGCLSCKN